MLRAVNRKIQRRFTIVLTVILFLGVLVTAWVVRETEHDMHAELLHEAHMVAPAININRVKALAGTEADITSPDYQRLKEQLAAIRAADLHFRFLYLLGLRSDGTIFFFVDNEPAGSKDYSPPGQIYDEASENIRQVFDTKTPIIEGPTADRWGTWVSALVPLLDPAGGKVIAVLGVDIDAGNWRWNIVSRAALSVVLVLLTLLLLLAWLNGARVAARLRDNEEKYRRFFATSRDGTFITSREGLIADANEVARQLFGYADQEEISHVNMRDLYADPDERGRLTERIRTDGHIEDYPIVMKRKDGTLIHCIVTAVVLKDINGVSVGFQGTIRDVTEKKKAEERFQQREATLAAITNSARDAILMLDPEGTISFWNPAAEQMLGYGAAEAVGKNLHSLIVPSRFRDAHHAAFPHFVATGQGAAVGKTLELAALRKDGTEIAVELSLSAVQLQGRWHAVGLMRDISERKRTEESLRKSEYLLRTMGHLADIGGWEFDVATLKQNWTDVVYKIHEIESDYEPTVGKGISFYAPEYQPIIDRAVQRAISHGEPFDLELQIITAKGNRRWVHALGQALRNDGKTTKLFGTIQDITDRKKAAEELRHANEQFSIMVRQLEIQRTRSDILTEMRQFLQATATVSETGPIVEKIMLKLFPASNGALYLMSASRTDLEEVARWGRHHNAPENVPILPDECWGIRRGNFYLVEDPKTALLCRHIVCREPGRYACLPLMAHGEVLGLLHICETPCRPDGERFFESLREVIGDIAEILSLSIANIKLRETLMFQSIKDPLTGLFNRRYLEETFIRETSRARRKKYPIGMIMTDIDHFKKFNDTHGHAAGDAVLTEIARLLGTSLRTADIVCRYGGEEFVLVLPEASLDDTVRRAEDICKRARELLVPFGDKKLGPVTLSMGVAGYPLHGEPLDVVLKLADMALYRAKKEGRDRVVTAEVS